MGEIKKRSAVLELLLCSAMWSIAGILMKLIPWSAFVIAGLRSLIGAAVAGAYMLAKKDRFVLNRHTAFGGVALCATMTLFCLANKTTTAANAIVLQFTAPIWILLISVLFLHKKLNKADLAATAATFLGIALFFADSLGAGKALGNVLAVGAGIAFACYYLSLAGCSDSERISVVVLANLLTFLVGLPFVFLTGPDLSLRPILLILILGVVQLGLPYILLVHASAFCPPLICSLMGALEPLLNPVWVALFYGEMPGPLALVGAVLVILAITAWCAADAGWSPKALHRSRP